MDIECEVQVEYTLSKQSGRWSKLVVQLTKDQWNDYVLFLPPKSRKQCFKIHGNIEKIYNQFEDQGKISLKFATPNVLVYFRGADPYVLSVLCQALEGIAEDSDFDIDQLMKGTSFFFFFLKSRTTRTTRTKR